MIKRIAFILILLGMLFPLSGSAQALPSSPTSLLYVPLDGSGAIQRFASTGLPAYARLENAVLAGADAAGRQVLQAAGLSFQVLDADIRRATYYLAYPMGERRTPQWSAYGRLLLEQDGFALLRMDPSRAEALSLVGVELRLVSLTAKPLPSAQAQAPFPDTIIPDPLVQIMMDMVTSNQVSIYDRQLAGELPVWVEGAWYTITSRQTYSGEPIRKTTVYVGQHMQDLGMDVEYHQWNSPSNPNVIGEITGLTNPDQIFIIGGHLDDVSGSPGADDNGSGSVATLIAADILSQYQWGCTLRFALWTGEEQGLLGSDVYAQRSFDNGENIVGYLNLDMIAWNTIASPRGIDLIYNPNMPPTQQLATLFSDVVSAYNLGLIPELRTSLGGGSDHQSFWDRGYTSILAIEDQGDFNPYYHSPNDTPAHTDLDFFTRFVKASLGTFVHMNSCLITSGLGQLDGHVAAAVSGQPIQGATVSAQDGQGHTFSNFTDAAGYYTRTLPADTYTVTASAYAYLPMTVGSVAVVTDTLTTQDFALTLAPTYTVSGLVSEVGTGAPLYAQISFTGAPTTVWTDPATGLYEASLPQGSYTMHVQAALHRPQERAITLDHDQVQDFTLERLPCVLLVDDDMNNPDVRSYYTNALDPLGVDYDIWDTSTAGDPALQDLSGYQKLLWFIGFPYNNTFTTSNEEAVGAFLDGGGNFFLSSQDYLYEMNLTAFGQNYLHIASYDDDVNHTQATGQNVFAGLGPYNLIYPFTNYSDIVQPDAQAQVAFRGNISPYNMAVSYDGTAFNTLFFGFPFEAVPQAANRQAVMQRALDFLGSCEVPMGWLEGYVTDAVSAAPLEGATITAGTAGQATTDLSGYYTMTLPTGTYQVTAEMTGYISQTAQAVIEDGLVTSLDFALQAPACEPVSGLDFTWQPILPTVLESVTFTGTASGTQPVSFGWDFGDGATASGPIASHIYMAAQTYPVTLTASNACTAPASVVQDITVTPSLLLHVYLPAVTKQ